MAVSVLNASLPPSTQKYDQRNTAATKIQRCFALYTFRKKIARLSELDGRPTILQQLDKITPQWMSPPTVVETIFNRCWAHNIPALLSAVQKKYSYTLTLYDQIRLQIVLDCKDNKYVLTNDSIKKMLEPVINSNEKFKECCKLAYNAEHPLIYQPPLQITRVEHYSLNFVWLNLEPQDREKDEAVTIFGDGSNHFENAECFMNPALFNALQEGTTTIENWEQIQNSVTYSLVEWLITQPKAVNVNLWYDSAFVTQKARDTTKKMFAAISKATSTTLHLQDLRSVLEKEHQEIRNCFHPSATLYFRVDLAKALATQAMMEKESQAYVVISDLDVKPMPVEQLFDQRTVEYLENTGFAFLAQGHFFENSFYVFNSEKNHLVTMHRKKIIERCQRQISGLRKHPLGVSLYPEKFLGSQTIFYHYHEAFELICSDSGELPRKPVQAPGSQFCDTRFRNHGFRAERFRFIGESNIPVVRNGGRGTHKEGYIPEHASWKAEPLP